MTDEYKNSHTRFINAQARLFNVPLLAHPDYAQSLQNVLLSRLGAKQFDVSCDIDFTAKGFNAFVPDQEQRQDVPEHVAFSRAPFRGYPSWYMLKSYEGIGVLPVRGSLTNDGPLGYASLGPSYKSLSDDFVEMSRDVNVDGIALYLHSPGGEVTGVSQALQTMLAAKNKPVWLFVNEHAYSAGYWLSMIADQIFITPSSGAGSIGVVYTHFNYQEALQNRGVEATFITSGMHKALGNSLEPLTERARAKLQHDSDQIWDHFAATVAEHRPDLSKSQVFDLEAATFRGQELIDRGLADQMVQSETEFLELFKEELSGDTSSAESQNASTVEATSSLHVEGQMTEEELKAAADAARDEGRQEAQQAADQRVNDVTGRFFAVMESDVVKEGRQELAMKWLKSESMANVSADEMIGMLADVPVKAEKPEIEEDDEDLGDDARALLAHAEQNAGTPKTSNRGEGSGDSDGTGDHRRADTAEPSTYKSQSSLPAPKKEYGATRGHMMDGFLATAKKFKEAQKARKRQV